MKTKIDYSCKENMYVFNVNYAYYIVVCIMAKKVEVEEVIEELQRYSSNNGLYFVTGIVFPSHILVKFVIADIASGLIG